MRQSISDTVTERIIGAAIAVHRELGPGFLESVYEEAMVVALAETQLVARRQVPVVVHFHGRPVGEHRLDLVVEGVVVELKAIKELEDVHFAVVRSYLCATHARIGLLLNFSGPVLQVRRVGPEFHGREQATGETRRDEFPRCNVASKGKPT